VHICDIAERSLRTQIPESTLYRREFTVVAVLLDISIHTLLGRRVYCRDGRFFQRLDQIKKKGYAPHRAMVLERRDREAGW
jgi:hypothetical protein